MARRKTRSGLVLLVVLGMLALLSLVSVTFLVFSSESRKASLQLARGDYRGTPADKLIDQAVKQVIRGTTDRRSPLWLNDILGDLYGESTDEPFQIQQPRSTVPATPDATYYGSMPQFIARDNPLRMGYQMPPGLTTFDSSSPEAPRLYGGHLLKIPVAWPFQSGDPRKVRLPEQHDAWTGRVVTFMQGPLEGQSFRILKYTGEVDIIPPGPSTPAILNPAEAANQYSIVIDLNEVRDRVTSKIYGSKMVTRSINDWISLTASTNCLELLYSSVVANGSVYTFDGGYTFFVNAGVTNSNGLGIDMAKNVDYTPLTTTPPTVYPSVPDAFLANHGRTYAYQSDRGITTYTPTGDTDEANDAVDFQNFYLAMRQAMPSPPPTGSDTSDLITPSFHRTAVINYLAAMAPNLSAFTGTGAEHKQLEDFIELVRRATGRPLSVRIKNFNSAAPVDYTINPSFTGSTLPDNRAGLGARSPQLLLDWPNINQSPNPENFQAWLRWLTRGPFDVDNDSDLVGDSVWLDLNFPLVSSPEGKLLKVLAAFYIEDMDGKLDINASGSREQSNDTTFTTGMPDTRFGYAATGTPVGQWPQGTGYGPADTSLRHIFNDYDAFLTLRWGSSAESVPGVSGDDAASTLNDRAFEDTSTGIRSYRYNNPQLFTAPVSLFGHYNSGFPFSVRGRAGIAVDLLGNPIFIENASQFNETNDDPYDSYVLKDRHSDLGISVSDWERLIRFNDVDRSSLPRALQNVASSLVPGQAGYFEKIRSISPRNVTLNLPRFAGEYDYPRAVPNFPNPPSIVNMRRRVSSFTEFVEGYAQARFAAATKPFFNRNAMRQLFPMEFRHNLPLNLNRPLGNGTDDNLNGSIDEADEIRAGQLARYPANQASTYTEVYVNLPSGYDPELEAETATATFTPAQFDGNQPKQFLARHLYCLAQLILPDNYVFPNNPTTTAPSVPLSAQDRKTRARILAQWAVNVVDFRDPDSTMTRFPYDEDPFTDTTNGVGWVPTDGVVFGMESPELLLTEAIALHDQRAIKNPNDSSKRIQYRIPQGSLFLEFYCPRTTSTLARGTSDGDIPPAMRDLYEFDATGTLKLNLGKMTPVDTYNPVSFPVWRVLLTDPVKNGALFKDKFTEVYEKKDDRFKYSYQMDNGPAKLNWKLDNSAPGPADITEPTIDRILWFSTVKPTNAPNLDNTAWSDPKSADKIFRGILGSNYVAGGQYLVVGPREITYLGSKDQANGTGPRFNRPSNQRIQLANGASFNWVQMWDLNNNPLFWAPPAPTPLVANNTATSATNWSFASKVRSAVTLIAAMDKPDSWTDATHNTYTIGLNVSEPTRDIYYPEPDEFANSKDTTRDTSTNAPGFAATGQPKDAYIDTDSNTMTTPRQPMDMSVANNYGYLKSQQWEQDTAYADLPRTKTEQHWNAAVLQRLADPNRGYHPKYNPYITVDWLSIPLTVFSGEEAFDPTPSTAVYLATRQKTGAILPVTQDTATSANAVTFFSYHTEFPTTASTASAPTTPLETFFSFPLPLEFVAKTPVQTAMTRPAPDDQQFATLGYLNDKFWLRGTAGTADDYEYAIEDRYKGSPGPNTITKVPVAPYFPNRDFVNPLELTSVSLSAPGQFMQEFTVPTALDPTKPLFTHVLDFEDLQVPKPTTAGLNLKRTTGMLLDLLTTKNPWPDAFKVEDPASVSVTTVANAEDRAKTSLFEPYKPPFNFLPTYREPGKINLNTLTEENVFRGLMWNAITPRSVSDRLGAVTLPFWAGFQNLRRGFIVPSASSAIPFGNPFLHSALPVEFAHPFNAANAFENAPSPMPTYDRASHAGVLRRGDTTTPSTTVPNTFQMATLGTATPDAKPRLFTANVNNVFPNGGVALSNVPMNTFIQNYPASRLANLTTDRSSVYAIRVTLGYFEADAAGNIGVEYGADQGRAKRYRSIYLIDRSIPVGYQPGQDLNTENIILMRRMIE